MNTCAECGRNKIEIFVDKISFGPGGGFYVPIHQCNDCGFKWTDHIADTIYDKNKEIFDRLEAENKRLEGVATMHASYEHSDYKTIQEQAERIKELEGLIRRILPMFIRYWHRHGALYEYTPTETAQCIIEVEQALNLSPREDTK